MPKELWLDWYIKAIPEGDRFPHVKSFSPFQKLQFAMSKSV